MRRVLLFGLGLGVLVVPAFPACSSNTSNGFFGDGGSPGDDGALSDVGNFGDGSGDGGGGGPPVIYAHTDAELYSMDPTSHQLTDIGPFDDGSGRAPVITDLAVNAGGDVWVNSETAIYSASLPASGKGAVKITLHTSLGTSSKFYALGFTTAGVLESGESLVAGDSLGRLYFIDVSTAQSTPQDLGGFGGNWQLSGDVVFFAVGGSPRGLATIRQCTPNCDTKNDSLAEIDMNALMQAYKSKTPASSLLKQTLGSGTGFGRLFGIGAWGDSVYAFSRASGSSNPAQLVQIGSSGSGKSLQTFSNITAGWSGAGVTTKAKISVIQ